MSFAAELAPLGRVPHHARLRVRAVEGRHDWPLKIFRALPKVAVAHPLLGGRAPVSPHPP